MFLELKDIGPDSLTFDGDVRVPDVEWYRGETIRFEAAHASLRVARPEGRFEMAGRVAVRVALTCGRCLDRWVWELETPVALHLVPAEPVEEVDAREVAEEREDEWRLDGTVLDLVRLCREFALLNLPLKPVCGRDCKGLCPQCGTNRNRGDCDCRATQLDPRLAPLLEFKKRLDSD